jgi:hypothetical protein
VGLSKLIAILLGSTLFLGAGASAYASATATDISGLYYTGLNSTGGLQSGGGRDNNWDVTYAYTNGTLYSGSSTYTSSAGAYVLSSTANTGGAANYIDGAYVPNTSAAQWITAPGAYTTATGGTINVGGDFLPGNGTTGTNAAFYVYQLAFTISGYINSGTSSTRINNDVAINLTIAADDAYYIYVTKNQVTVDSSGNISADYAVSASGTSAWNNTTSQTLANYTDSGSGITDNTTFNLGTNYLTVVVRNTNSQTGTNGSTALNASGLLVYQVGALGIIDGRVVPEVGACLPLLGAVGLYGFAMIRRRKEADSISTTA